MTKAKTPQCLIHLGNYIRSTDLILFTRCIGKKQLLVKILVLLGMTTFDICTKFCDMCYLIE